MELQREGEGQRDCKKESNCSQSSAQDGWVCTMSQGLRLGYGQRREGRAVQKTSLGPTSHFSCTDEHREAEPFPSAFHSQVCPLPRGSPSPSEGGPINALESGNQTSLNSHPCFQWCLQWEGEEWRCPCVHGLEGVEEGAYRVWSFWRTLETFCLIHNIGRWGNLFKWCEFHQQDQD